MSRPVVIRDKAGAEYEIESASVAKKAHPDAKIVRFADTGEDYAEDAPRTEEAARRVAAEPKDAKE